jgi:hypothetical protein
VVVLALTTGGCAVDRIVHEEGAGADASADGSASADGGAVDRGGNFPEPALTLCGALPEGVDAIEGLVTAHAVTGPRAPSGLPDVADPNAVRIRLSSRGFEAGEMMVMAPPEGPVDAPCEQAWAFAFDIPVEHIAVGVHALGDMAPAFPEQHFADLFEYEEGCGEGGEVGEDGGATSILDSSGELEIFAVTDGCIVGELRGVQSEGVPAVLKSGGFVAPRTALECVPSSYAACD